MWIVGTADVEDEIVTKQYGIRCQRKTDHRALYSH